MSPSAQRLIAIAGLAGALQSAQAGDGFNAGLELRANAQLADIGLPAYPGAVPQRDEGESGPGATLGLWGGSLGFRLVVLKYASSDGVDRVARFYREALARNGGPVLDCSHPDPKPAIDDRQLHCADDHPPPGGQLYKSGLPNRMLMVAIEPAPRGQGSRFVLLRMATGAP